MQIESRLESPMLAGRGLLTRFYIGLFSALGLLLFKFSLVFSGLLFVIMDRIAEGTKEVEISRPSQPLRAGDAP